MPRQRRHTVHFLAHARAAFPVFLDSQVDVSRILAHRNCAAANGRRYSIVSYVLSAVVTTMTTRPSANAAVTAGRLPRIARYDQVRPKLAVDRTVDGERVVLAAVLPDLRKAPLDEIQAHVDRIRDTAADEVPEFRGALLLHRLPGWVGRLAFGAAVRPLARRPRMLGTVAVSSLGHRNVDAFHASGGTVVTVNVGAVRETPVVRDGQISIAPTLRLNLCFDHRALDGAEAADVLTDIARELEQWPIPTAAPADGKNDNADD